MSWTNRDKEAEEARFQDFIRSTDRSERDWIAFLEFERAVHLVADRGAMVNPFNDFERHVREVDVLEGPVAAMLFTAVKRLSLGVMLANAEGIGHALRFGLIEARPDGLASVPDDDALAALARRGDDALRADMDAVQERVMDERARRAKRAHGGRGKRRQG